MTVSMLGGLLMSALLLWTPLALAALGGLLHRVSGVVNIGLEGQMLTGALVGAVVSGATGDWALGVLAAGAAGGLIGLLMSLCITRLGANEIIAGLGFTIVLSGLIGYLLRSVFDVSGTLRVAGLDPLPRILGLDPLFWLTIIFVPLIGWSLRNTVAGLRLRATGDGFDAANALGLPANGIRDIAGTLAGVFAGIAGSHLVLGQVGLFNENMVAGRGFIALAAFYFGRARPLPTALACLLFAVFDAAQARLQTAGVPAQLIQTLPYVVVIAVLTATAVRGVRGRVRRAG
ncbi:ABC transporter permease [Kibdelosporangium persicum]|uniref:Branched-chain amino acid transport system / permease component n=1 Tax=Kibdelosporangium persicum TaxID=2698649 RepID=A0ABX2FJJ2_9PSEU|nr:ABC transporter permease [Kibdelosporangium persicum]NRN71294.1 Branched-chain amino acid transport system / permease component [Kibdelosporangium persicum]